MESDRPRCVYWATRIAKLEAVRAALAPPRTVEGHIIAGVTEVDRHARIRAILEARTGKSCMCSASSWSQAKRRRSNEPRSVTPGRRAGSGERRHYCRLICWPPTQALIPFVQIF